MIAAATFDVLGEEYSSIMTTSGLAKLAEAAALRDEVSNLDAEIDVLRGALKAAGDRVTAASLEERAREAARAILAASSRR